MSEKSRLHISLGAETTEKLFRDCAAMEMSISAYLTGLIRGKIRVKEGKEEQAEVGQTAKQALRGQSEQVKALWKVVEGAYEQRLLGACKGDMEKFRRWFSEQYERAHGLLAEGDEQGLQEFVDQKPWLKRENVTEEERVEEVQETTKLARAWLGGGDR